MTAEMLRPATAAKRFDVSERTLSRWASDGLIGWSKIGAAVWYSASDIAELLASNVNPRTVVPIAPATPVDDSWREQLLSYGKRAVR